MCASLRIRTVVGSEGRIAVLPSLGLEYLDIEILTNECLDVKKFAVKMYAVAPTSEDHVDRFLQRLAILPLALIAGRTFAARNPAAGSADIAALQSNWKMLLASNADVAPSSDALKLPADE